MQLFYDRTAPAEWTARLRDVSPMSDDMGWLELVWESGDPWSPVQRWGLWEMLHPSIVDPAELAELRGPHPRMHGHPCTSVPISSWHIKPPDNYRPCLCRHKSEAWKGSHSMVSLDEWKLFQRTGYVGRPFWTIQGRSGGHKIGFTHQESLLLESEGYPTEAPPAGALAYAPFDNRVVSQIMRFNRLMAFNNNAEEYRAAMGEGYEKYQGDVARELRRQLVAHLKDQMEEVNELFIRAAEKGQMDKLPRTKVDYDRLAELSEASYVETGQLLSTRTAIAN